MKRRTSAQASAAPATNPFEIRHNLFEVCERRLVFSAQLLFEAFGPSEAPQASPGDTPLQMHAMPATGDASHLHLESHLREAHAASGWNSVQQQFGLTGAGQTVAVIDSGIAWDHVALGRGFGAGYRVVGGWDFTEENDNQPYDDGPAGFHGTHVAGIIGSDDPQHSGVAPGADLVALRVFNDLGQGQLAWVERALDWVHTHRNAFENPITTVNLSLGTAWNSNTIPNWATLEDELQRLASDGVVVVASAGNSFQSYQTVGLSYPAASPYVLPVASVGDDGELSDFSQRNSRVLAAPGERILSTVPDHVLGRDGRVDDFSGASGTSMSAPYVAGASVLVRQAMEMVGYESIGLSSIVEHLHRTADSVYDTLTGSFYDRLNLATAIDELIPNDDVGDHASTAATLDLNQSHMTGWINHLGDQDVFRFTATASGTLAMDVDSAWLDGLSWTISTQGRSIAQGGLGSESIPLLADQSYELIVSANREIGTFAIDLDFAASGNATPGVGEGAPTAPPLQIGQIDYFEQTYSPGAALRAQASRDGIFTVQWHDQGASVGSLHVTTADGRSIADTSWTQDALRVDLQVRAGDWLDIRVPSSGSSAGELTLANVVAQAGSQLSVTGTVASDAVAVNLQNGLALKFGAVDYAFANGEISHLRLDGYGNNDSLHIVGSTQSDKVDLTPGRSLIENRMIQVDIVSMEQIAYTSGGGPDRVYLYDSDTDDTLIARPRQAELTGVGYRFEVSDVDRIFMHATGGGQDYAYLYDSSGDDRLSMRPQFTSLSGPGFFNYVRGFERVYAYANAGGWDQADLYDSSGDDRFTSNGSSASMVGPGFSSYTKSFDVVHAHAGAGGQDWATLYGSSQQTNWQRGADFVSYQEQNWSREARGFNNVSSFVAGQPLHVATLDDWSELSDWPRLALDHPDAPVAEAVHGLSPDAQISCRNAWSAEQFYFPEEKLLTDPDLELRLLDELFRRHAELL